MVTVGYNPSTGKALMGTGGALCIGCCGGAPACNTCNMPSVLNITLSNFANRCYQVDTGGDSNFAYWSDDLAAIVNGKHTLPVRYYLGNPQSCQYELSLGNIERFKVEKSSDTPPAADCDDAPTTTDSPEWQINLTFYSGSGNNINSCYLVIAPLGAGQGSGFGAYYNFDAPVGGDECLRPINANTGAVEYMLTNTNWNSSLLLDDYT